MIPFVSHDRSDESPEAKAAWFQSLTVEERMELFCELTELALAAHPELGNQKHAQPVSGRVQVLELP
jgi:hypothetical protein